LSRRVWPQRRSFAMFCNCSGRGGRRTCWRSAVSERSLRPFLPLALAGLAVLASLASVSFAAAEDTVLNEQGYWQVGRGDADSGSCHAALTNKNGAVFMLLAANGEVALSVARKSPLKGRTGRLTTEAYAFKFKPEFGEDGSLFSETLPPEAVAALRLARTLGVELDGRAVFEAAVEDTGLEGALDAVVACSRGEKGWWGPGVDPDKAAEFSYGRWNREGVWKVGAWQDSQACHAIAEAGPGVLISFMGMPDGVSFTVEGSRIRSGRKGVFETEAYAFVFEPTFGDGHFYLDDVMNERSLAALRLAKALRISVDGRVAANLRLEGTGLAGVLDGLADCAAGRSGWWGPGLRADSASGAGGDAAKAGDGVGTGFFISDDGVAVTAAHVVADCKVVESPRWGAAKVVAVDRRADLSILRMASASGQALALRDRGPRLGEPLTAAGYPLGGLVGSGLKVTTGVVSGLAGLDGDRGNFQMSAPVQGGNSGGPVVDGGGRLIGVAVSKLDAVAVARATGDLPQNVNFAVPVAVLQAFLEENGVAYRTAGSAATPPLTGVTFSLLCRR
jgi:S1-C subfamily serine protease